MPDEERAALVLLLGWATITIAELLIGLKPIVSTVLTVLETLAVPVFVVAALAMARREIPEAAVGAQRSRVRARWIRTLGFLTVIVLLVSGCLFGQYQVLYEALTETTDVAALTSSYRSYAVARFLLVTLALIGSPRRLATVVASIADRPARLMAGSFGLVALIGALLLALPMSLQRVEDASLVDALFNAVSAVCVTGLSTANVAETYSPIGQAILFALFQVGGLGIMSLSTFFAVVAGRRLHARRAAAMAQLLDVESFASLRRSLLRIVAFTLVVELVGAGLLYLALGAHPDVAFSAGESASAKAGAGSRLWAAVFHAVSAFCNAGFSNFRGGAMPFADSWAVSGVLMVLIVFGGLGFICVFELIERLWSLLRGKRRKPLSLHTRIVLMMSGVLIGIGAVAFLVLERNASMRDLDWDVRVLTAVFQAITCRTAGFSTLDFGLMQPTTLMFACALMFIGASPGSTGGGAKTTTVMVLFLTLRAELRRRTQPVFMGRAVSVSTVRRAIAVIFMTVTVVATLLFVLFATESASPIRLAFEAVSAVSTTGLSTGITDALSVAGKLAVTFGMFIGRIGPLTLALVVADDRPKARFRYVEERIAIG